MLAILSEVRGFGGSPMEESGISAWVPGCLTGESEERETWTAESPRTAISLGLACSQVGFNADMRSDETSAVDVSGQHPLLHADVERVRRKSCSRSSRAHRSGTSSNVVISRVKFSSNLRV